MRIKPLAEMEREQIALALSALGGDKRAAAEALGISLNTLYNRINEYGDGFDWETSRVRPVPPAAPSAGALWFWEFEPPQVVRRPEEIIAQCIELHVGKICVYEHVRDGEVVYVGMGQWNRPFADSRNDLWNQEMGKYGAVQIRILDWFDNDRDARAFEAEVIKYRRPRLNIQMNTPLQSFDFAALPV